MTPKPKILVAPLNWGLGHATRCIPIIKELLNHGFEPIIASDGVALTLLQAEFPDLKALELPSYQITYPKKGKHFKFKMIWNSPKMLKAIKSEKKIVKQICNELGISGIISDNRLGVYYKKVPSVFITHQLTVLTGNTTWFSSKVHEKIIQKFQMCWVPDVPSKQNLSGKLGRNDHLSVPIAHLGPLSRFEKKELEKKYKLLILLSGPEPQRTLLEEKILTEIAFFKEACLLVRGVVDPNAEQIKHDLDHLTAVNFMTSKDLEQAVNSSEMVLCRSGYTTIMDLAKLEKKAFFIPTPGQYEQEYLAKSLDEQGVVPMATQDDFSIGMLKKILDYKGLKSFTYQANYSSLFGVFSRVKENSEPTSGTLST